jgi:hypothetical protein
VGVAVRAGHPVTKGAFKGYVWVRDSTRQLTASINEGMSRFYEEARADYRRMTPAAAQPPPETPEAPRWGRPRRAATPV